MNVRDLLKAVEDRIKDAGDEAVKPILLPVHVWHAAKASYMREFGEGTMFAHPQHPQSFMVGGVPVVADADQPEANADGLLPVAANDKSTNADRILHQDGTSAAIAEASTRAAPPSDKPQPAESAPQAGVQVGEPRPELELQEEPAVEMDEKGILRHVEPKKADEPEAEPMPLEGGEVEEPVKPLEPTFLGGHTEGGQERQDDKRDATAPVPEDDAATHKLDPHEDHEPATGFAAMSHKADEQNAATQAFEDKYVR